MLSKCLSCGAKCDLGDMHCRRCVARSGGNITDCEVMRTLRKLEELANGARE